jgi:hypothetical protein
MINNVAPPNLDIRAKWVFSHFMHFSRQAGRKYADFWQTVKALLLSKWKVWQFNFQRT